MRKGVLLLLSILSGALLWLSWYPVGLTFLSFIAFVPLFIISDELLKREYKVALWQGIIYSYPAFLIWNAATTWWIWNSTPPGAIAAIVLNSFFISLVFGLWQWFRAQNPPKITVPLAFIALWCSWEFLHLHWDISWPWLNLGNVFAPCTRFIQWYEYTGAFGGTIWLLFANFLLYYFIQYFKNNRRNAFIFLCYFGAWIIVPATISLLLYHQYKPKYDNPIETIIIQQNTDPWEEQYRMSNFEHAKRLIKVASPLIDANTQLIVAPESAIPHTVLGEALLTGQYSAFHPNYQGFILLDSLIAHFPDINIITGLSTCNVFTTKIRPTAREHGESLFVEMYNTATCINKNGISSLYYKSKLVPGVELMPYPAIFGFLEKLIIDLGGPNTSLGIDTMQHPLQTTVMDGLIKIGTPVCYESIYGEHFAEFVRNGAQLMTVITNDSWWKETPGHQQHFIYAKLRAIETRRSIARAANTGISAFIDEKGDLHQKTKYGERIAIKQPLYPNDRITFYVKHGDYLARIALGLTILLAFYGIYLWILRRAGYQR